MSISFVSGGVGLPSTTMLRGRSSAGLGPSRGGRSHRSGSVFLAAVEGERSRRAEEPSYGAFEELLNRGGGGGKGGGKDQGRKLPPRNGFLEDPVRRDAAEEARRNQGPSQDDQYRMFDAYLSGKPDVVDPPAVRPPPSRPGSSSASFASQIHLQKPPSRDPKGQQTPPPPSRPTPPRPFDALLEEKPNSVSPRPDVAKPRAPFPRPTYSELDQLLSREDALQWTRRREQSSDSTVLPTARVGDVISAAEWEQLCGERPTSTTQVYLCLLSPTGGSLSASWLHLLSEVSGKVATDDVSIVAVSSRENQRTLDRTRKKRAIRFPLVEDQNQSWTRKFGPKRTVLLEATSAESGDVTLRVAEIFHDVSAEGGHVEELTSAVRTRRDRDELSAAGGEPSAPREPVRSPYPHPSSPVRPSPPSRASSLEEVAARRREEEEVEEEGELPLLLAPRMGKYVSRKKVGDRVEVDLFGAVESDLLLVYLAPAGVATPEWVRLLAEISAKVDHAEKMRRKQNVRFPVVLDEDAGWLHGYGQRSAYLFEVEGCTEGVVNASILKIWNDVAPGSGHAEELHTEVHRRLKELHAHDEVAELRTPVQRVVVEEPPPVLEAVVPSPAPKETPVPELKSSPRRTRTEDGAEEAEDEHPAVPRSRETSVPELTAPARSVAVPDDAEEGGSRETLAALQQEDPELKESPKRPSIDRESLKPPRHPDDAARILDDLRAAMRERPQVKRAEKLEGGTRNYTLRELASRERIRSSAIDKVVSNQEYDLKGLRRFLRRLAETESITKIVLGRVQELKADGGGLRVRVATITKGGFNMVAKVGAESQSVFVETTLTREELIQSVVNIFKFRRERRPSILTATEPTGGDGASDETPSLDPSAPSVQREEDDDDGDQESGED